MEKIAVDKGLIRQIQRERSDRLKSLARATSRKVPMRRKARDSTYPSPLPVPPDGGQEPQVNYLGIARKP